jgi:hypothetical protein
VPIRRTPLSLDEVFQAVGEEAAGGIALFVGTVRNHDAGADVGGLGYSCHPTAEAEMRRIAEKVAAGRRVGGSVRSAVVGGWWSGDGWAGRCVAPSSARAGPTSQRSGSVSRLASIRRASSEREPGSAW